MSVRKLCNLIFPQARYLREYSSVSDDQYTASPLKMPTLSPSRNQGSDSKSPTKTQSPKKGSQSPTKSSQSSTTAVQNPDKKEQLQALLRNVEGSITAEDYCECRDQLFGDEGGYLLFDSQQSSCLASVLYCALLAEGLGTSGKRLTTDDLKTLSSPAVLFAFGWARAEKWVAEKAKSDEEKEKDDEKDIVQNIRNATAETVGGAELQELLSTEMERMSDLWQKGEGQNMLSEMPKLIGKLRQLVRVKMAGEKVERG